ncbi:MAG: alkaline phosphatase family protein [Clostridia bacterium]|nr:alkaline phosphatase family protein [Clostridia bacterium]
MAAYKRVALIGVDGAGNFFRNADTPNLDRIFRDGSVAYDVYTSKPSISAECWGSMLHGVTPDMHRLTNGICSSIPYDTKSLFPSAFRVIRENDPDCELASFCNWNPINFGIIENDLGVYKDTARDAELTDRICAYLEEHDPKFLFVQFDEVDGAGHRNDYGTKAHLDQITITDGYIGRIWEAYEKRGFIEDTLFIVTADHGGFRCSHGGETDAEMLVMYALSGRTVQKGGAAADMQIRDSASVVLYALGYEQPESWTSMVPSGVFEGVTAGERPVYQVAYTCAHRTHESTPTPEPTVVSVLGEDCVKAYFPFDDDNAEKTGKMPAEAAGKFYYLDGYFGKSMRFDDGCLTAESFKPGKNSFSIALWLKTGGVAGDPSILSNKNWVTGKNSGFIFGVRGPTVFFNYGNGQERSDIAAMLPLDYNDGWVYVVGSVDREANAVGFSVDFEPMVFRPLKEEFRGESFDTELPLCIGQDGTGEYKHHLSALLDEMVIVDRVLTDDDIAALKEFYGV